MGMVGDMFEFDGGIVPDPTVGMWFISLRSEERSRC